LPRLSPPERHVTRWVRSRSFVSRVSCLPQRRRRKRLRRVRRRQRRCRWRRRQRRRKPPRRTERRGVAGGEGGASRYRALRLPPSADRVCSNYLRQEQSGSPSSQVHVAEDAPSGVRDALTTGRTGVTPSRTIPSPSLGSASVIRDDVDARCILNATTIAPAAISATTLNATPSTRRACHRRATRGIAPGSRYGDPSTAFSLPDLPTPK
jgi:hypothetical protein